MSPNPDYDSIFTLGTQKANTLNFVSGNRIADEGSTVTDSFYMVNGSGLDTLGVSTFRKDADNLPAYQLQTMDANGSLTSNIQSNSYATKVAAESLFQVSSSVSQFSCSSVILGNSQAGINVDIGLYWRLYVDESTNLLVQFYNSTTKTYETKFTFKSLSN